MCSCLMCHGIPNDGMSFQSNESRLHPKTSEQTRRKVHNTTDDVVSTMRLEETNLLDKIGRDIHEAIIQICGGGIQHAEEEQLRDIVRSSISFPNNKHPSDVGGKPHDIEVRVAMSLFHRWRRSSGNSTIQVISDLGITRDITAPRRLAELCVPLLEDACREDGIAYDIRTQPSGVICIVTYERSERLRQAGKLPCPHCCQWCKGN
jgi:hypothetical protein